MSTTLVSTWASCLTSYFVFCRFKAPTKNIPYSATFRADSKTTMDVGDKICWWQVCHRSQSIERYYFQIDKRLMSAAVSLIYFVVIFAIQLKTPKALDKIKREKTLIFAFSIVIGFGFAINFLLRLVFISRLSWLSHWLVKMFVFDWLSVNDYENH